jgi:hypothetical protein
MVVAEVMATVGITVSLRTEALACGAVFPAESEWFAVMRRFAESAAALTLTAPVVQLPPLQLGLKARPPMLTFTCRPFSEQVPVTV